eukprot:CAMPEP_0194346562 /NCGR_PEP_ID=MMETSP0171-20130528/105500_1 /TAXON_ID=218684 /ORGANISM="Corethron pennatum, Strain L29A3" /LENGTH=633 /DNA_ID=CAMNT_0039113705 /DNA_START=34 /DNA_END=1932 /DNA_ORIENTATION=-
MKVLNYGLRERNHSSGFLPDAKSILFTLALMGTGYVECAFSTNIYENQIYDISSGLESLGTVPDSLEKSILEIERDLCTDDTSFSGTVGGFEDVTCDLLQKKTSLEQDDYCIKFPDGSNQEIFRFCPTSCGFDCLQTGHSLPDSDSESMVFRSLKQEVCEDNDAFTFEYVDSKIEGQEANSCAELRLLKPVSVFNRACRKTYRYPTSQSPKVALSIICSRSCGECPDTEAPTQAPTVETCKDDDTYTFVYEDSKDPTQTANSCADLPLFSKEAVLNRACRKTYKYPTGKSPKVELSTICPRSCGICPDTEAPTQAPVKSITDAPSQAPTGGPCADDDTYTFEYEDSKDPTQTANSCADLRLFSKEVVLNRACRKTYKYPTRQSPKVALSTICPRSCGICPDTEAPVTSITEAPSQAPTEGPCEDDNAFTFEYVDLRDSEQTANSCAEVPLLKPVSALNRACRTKYRYEGKSGKVELKTICSRSCGICPPTEAPTDSPTKTPTLAPTASDVCEDDNGFEFNYVDRVTKKTADSCAEVFLLKPVSVFNRACKKKFSYGGEGKVELKLICSRSCGICPPTEAPTESPTDVKPPTDSPTETPTESPTMAPTESPTTEPTESPTTTPTESPTTTPTES